MLKNKISNRLISVFVTLAIIIASMPVSIIAKDLSSIINNDELVPSQPSIEETVTTTEGLTEKVELRDKFTKHYHDSNGNGYAVIFPEQVHYEENGEWKDIDNSLHLDVQKNKYVSNNEIFKTEFSKQSNDSQLVTLEDGEYKLSWAVSFDTNNNAELAVASVSQVEPNRTISNVSAQIIEQVDNDFEIKTEENITSMGKVMSAIKYSDVFDNSVDIRYSVLHGKVEEDIILKSLGDFTSYTLTVDTNGLTAVKQADNSVLFVNDDGESIFTLNAPWMKDSSVGVSDNISVTVSQQGETAYIKYTPDAEWLRDESRVYPVLIDPSFKTRFYTDNYEDTYISSGGSSSATRGSETTIKVGNIAGTTYFGLIKILNIPTLDDTYQIIGGGLTLCANPNNAPKLDLHRIVCLEDWDEHDIFYDNIVIHPTIKTGVSGVSLGPDLEYYFDLDDWILSLIDYGGANVFFNSQSWQGFMLSCTSNITNSYAEIYSSEYSSTSYRPILTLTYEYDTETGLQDNAVYSFVNAGSGKYLTVATQSTSEGTNVYQSTKNNSIYQSFKLDFDDALGGMRIRAMCSNNGAGAVLGFNYRYSINTNSGYAFSNVELHSYSESITTYDDQKWLIYPYGDNNYFKIVSMSDPNLALTAWGTSNGTPEGTMLLDPGNVSVCEFTGESNQLWKIESGGVQILWDGITKLVDQSSTAITLKEGKTGTTLLCPVYNFGDTLTWSSENTHCVEISQTGELVAKSAGSSEITATITHADNTVTTYDMTVYVKLENGVYYFTNVSNNYQIELGGQDAYGEMEPIKAQSRSSTYVPTETHQFFKIDYLGNGLYSMRSMLDNSMGWYESGTTVKSATIGTANDDVPSSGNWYLSTNANGYYIKPYQSSSLALTCPSASGSNCTLQTYSSTSTLQNWTLTKVTTQYNGITIKAQTDNLAVGDTFQFDAGFYSSTAQQNGQNGIVWSVDEVTGSADIDLTTGELTGTSIGAIVVTATYRQSDTMIWSTDIYVTVIPLSDGTYYIKNKEFDNFMQIDDGSASSTNGAIMELWNFDNHTDQRWIFEQLDNGYYKITNGASGKALTAPTSLDASITQKDYAGLSTQQWRISVTYPTYTLSPSSNLNYYMAAGEGIITSDGRNVEMRQNQPDNKDLWEIIKRISPSGNEIPYNPSLWNNSDVIKKTNCYSYALNNQVYNNTNLLWAMQPGEAAGYLLSRENICSETVEKYVIEDSKVLGFHFEKIGKYDECPENTYKVALVVDPSNDYHWYRQNPDGTWSHKRGQTEVINVDADGNLIYDPEVANRNYGTVLDYSDFVGFYAVSPINNLYSNSDILYMSTNTISFDIVEFSDQKSSLPSYGDALCIQKDMLYSEVENILGKANRMRTFGLMVVEYDLMDSKTLVVEYTRNKDGTLRVYTTTLE